MSGSPLPARGFHLFVYGSLRSTGAANELLTGAHHVADGVVRGTLFDVDGEYTALMLYGTTVVHGEIWHVPDAARLARLDVYEGVAEGLFRRIGVQVDGYGCWVYVAGPKLARRLGRRDGD